MPIEKTHGTGNFVPGSVSIVDYNAANKNLLVRGSGGFIPGFTMATLKAAITASANFGDTGITLNDDTIIIDFCLIGYGSTNLKDLKIVSKEMAWFSSVNPPVNGSGGPYPTCIPANVSGLGNSVMVYWAVQAIGGTPPTAAGDSWDGAGAVDQSILSSSSPGYYDFSGLVPAIYAALNNNPTAINGFPAISIENAIIYVHCDSGINRTGAAIISYFMQYGSNISAWGLAPNPTFPYYTLAQGQTAASLATIVGNTPVGGTDQGVAEAYCNFINTQSPTADLSARCVPLPNTVN